MIRRILKNNYVKRVLGLTFILFAISFNAHSQVHSNAIGLRIYKGEFTTGAELSYQASGTGKDRVEIDLGYINNNNQPERFYLVGIPNSGWGNIVKGLNWYSGSACSLGYLPSVKSDLMIFETFTFGLGAQVGLEYDFDKHDTPILVSFDIRPMYKVSLLDGYYSGFTWDTALSIRYVW